MLGRPSKRLARAPGEAQYNLSSLFTLKFSDVPTWVEARIDQTEHSQLQTGMCALLAGHLRDVFKESNSKNQALFLPKMAIHTPEAKQP